MCSLTVPDQTPNLGLFWYFFTETFEHFRIFFLCVFQINAFVYILPLTVRFRYVYVCVYNLCVYVCVCVYLRTYVHAHLHPATYSQVQVCACVCVYNYVCVCTVYVWQSQVETNISVGGVIDIQKDCDSEIYCACISIIHRKSGVISIKHSRDITDPLEWNNVRFLPVTATCVYLCMYMHIYTLPFTVRFSTYMCYMCTCVYCRSMLSSTYSLRFRCVHNNYVYMCVPTCTYIRTSLYNQVQVNVCMSCDYVPYCVSPTHGVCTCVHLYVFILPCDEMCNVLLMLSGL